MSEQKTVFYLSGKFWILIITIIALVVLAVLGKGSDTLFQALYMLLGVGGGSYVARRGKVNGSDS